MSAALGVDFPMIKNTTFDNINYKQTGNYCVLASYATSSTPFLFPKVEVIDFFLAFCKHYNIVADKSNAEELYLAKFIEEYSKPGKNGYQVINELHNSSPHELFVRCRCTFSLSPKETSKEIAEIENELIKNECCLMLFIGGKKMHSVTVYYDNGFWIYDVNEGKSVSIDRITSLGELGQSFLIKRIND